MNVKKCAVYSLLIAGCGFVFSSCSDDDIINNAPAEPASDMAVDMPAQPGQAAQKADLTCRRPTYISPALFGGDPGRQADLRRSFPVESSEGGAMVCVFDASEVSNGNPAIDAAYRRGAVVAIASPTRATLDALKAMGHDTAAGMFSFDSREMMAYDNLGHNYMLVDGGNCEESSTAEEAMSPDEIAAMEAGVKAEESVDATAADAADDEADDSAENPFGTLSGWVNGIGEEQMASLSRAAANSLQDPLYTPAAQIDTSCKSIDINFKVDIPRTKINSIPLSDSDYFGAKTTYIRVNYKIYPLHVFNSQNQLGNQMDGDYYIVEGGAVAQNHDCFGLYNKKHGAIYTHARGWFMTNLYLDYQLVDSKGQPAKAQFYASPEPTTTINQTSYTKSITHSFNANIGGMYMAGAFVPMGMVGYSCSWGSSVTQNLCDLDVRLNTAANASVSYHYGVNNIDFKTTSDASTSGLPLVSYNDLTTNNTWVWKLLRNDDNRVADNSNEEFSIRIKVRADYQLHRYQSVHYNKKTYGFTYTSDNVTAAMGKPTRQPFGTLAVKNTTDLTMAKLVIWKADENGNKIGDPIEDCTYSDKAICKTEYLRRKLYEGTYYVEFQTFKDFDKTGTYCFKNVRIKSGINEEMSTTILSSPDAEVVGGAAGK